MSSPYRPYFQQYQQAQQDPLSAALQTPGTQRGPLSFNMESVGELGKQMGAEAEANKKPRVWETKVDSEGNMTLKTDQETVNWVTSSAKKYQELMAGYAQTLQQQQAYAQHRLNNQNPLINVLGTFASNIARQPNMPGVTQALGQTAAQLNPTRDQLEAKQLGLYEHAANMAGTEADRALKQEQVRAAHEQRKATLEQKYFAEQDRFAATVLGQIRGGKVPTPEAIDRMASGDRPRIAPEHAELLKSSAETYRDYEAMKTEERAARIENENFQKQMERDLKAQIASLNNNTKLKGIAMQQSGAMARTVVTGQLKTDALKHWTNISKAGAALGEKITKEKDRVDKAEERLAKAKASGADKSIIASMEANYEAQKRTSQLNIDQWSKQKAEADEMASRLEPVAQAQIGKTVGNAPAAQAGAKEMTVEGTDANGKPVTLVLRNNQWVPKK